MIDPETGWDDLVWRPGPLGPDRPGEPEPLDIVTGQQETGGPQSVRDLTNFYPEVPSNLPDYLHPDEVAGIGGLPDRVYAQAAQMPKDPQAGQGPEGQVPAAQANGAGTGTLPPGVDWKFIAGREDTRTQGYVPLDANKHPDSNSGATIATGFDLGQHNAADLRALGMPDDFINRVSPLLAPQDRKGQPLLGQAAQDYLTAHPLTITPAEVQQLDTAAASQEYNQVARAYNGAQTTGARFQDLPQDAQTAIMDIAHQYGAAGLPDSAPNFWNQVTNGQWQAAHDNLMAFKDKNPTRRKQEAGLLLNAINSGNLPQPTRRGP
jgi:hypothetical protein